MRRRAAGDLLAAILLVNAVCMGAALAAMVTWARSASGANAWGAWPFALVWTVAVALAVAFFRTVPEAPPPGAPTDLDKNDARNAATP